jgi:hypothetical protein
LQVLERNLAHENAGATLNGIASGTLAPCVLPWIPLMRDGDDPGIIQRWLELAQAEPNSQRRGEYGGLARVFAEATPHFSSWNQTLKGWNMRDSQVVQEWIAEGEIIGEIKALLRLLEKKFPPGAPAELKETINKSTNLDQLKRWFDAAIDAGSLDEFRRVVSS